LPNYAQIDVAGRVHTIMQSPEEIQGPSVIEITILDTKYLNCLWDGSIFRKLAITVEKTNLAINEVTSVNIRWVDVDGNPVDYGEDIELRCGDLTEPIKMVNGQGTITTFESAEPGGFELIAVSPRGVKASIKVVVS